MSEKDYEEMSNSEKKKEDWMNSKWRPAMGWLYMLVCFCDFVLFPVLHAIYIAALYKGAVPPGVPPQWNPLTLQGAGLFHLAMGAVLGLAAYGRTQEKLGGANNGGISLPSSTGGFGAPAASVGVGTTSQTIINNPSNVWGSGSSNTAPAASSATSFGGSSFGGSGFGSAPAPSTAGQTGPTSFGSSGKLGPPPPSFPEL